MKTIQETRFECLKLANILATTKIITASAVLGVAESYYGWVTLDLREQKNPGGVTLVTKEDLALAARQAIDPFEVMKRTY